jgi:hypothetical protein
MYKELMTLFDEYDDIVYLVDISDDSIVYMNKAGYTSMGYTSMYEVLGRKCHELLRGFVHHCADCENQNLRPRCYISRNVSNPLLHKFYAMRSTLLEFDGKSFNLTIAVDMGTELRQFGKTMQLVTIGNIMSGAQEAALKCSDVNDAIHALMKFLGEHLECDRVYIFEEEEGMTCSNTYEWCAEGVSPEKDNLQHVPYEVMKQWYDLFDTRKNVVIEDLEKYKDEDPLMYEYLKPQGIHSLVVGPLILRGKRIGYYGVDNPPYNDIEYLSSSYSILGSFISLLIATRDFKYGKGVVPDNQ